MTHILRLMALSALVLAAACSSPARFGDGAGGAFGPGKAGVDAASDPTSPVFFSQTIGDRVLFAVDQATLSAEAQTVLEAQAGWLMTNADYTAIIEGHADEQGTTEYNIALSARRANAVREYLVARGVASNRLRTLPLGKERPALLCAEESCYEQNRRAVTVISTGTDTGAPLS